MINLNPNILIQNSNQYSRIITQGINARYQSVLGLRRIEINPFTGTPYTQLFEISGIFDFSLVKDLLTKPFPGICSEYPELKNYLLTCNLVHYSSFKIDTELKKSEPQITQEKRNKYRKDYVERYMNPWIQSFVIAHPHYDKNVLEFKEFIEEIKEHLIQLNNHIKNIIDYSFLDSDIRHELLNKLAIEVCPYCNRQYITRYLKGKKLRSTADLDHFYPKSIYQLFTLSLFNFVPSCQICNSRFKLAKSSEILYPYENGFDEDAYFKVKLNSKSTLDSITGQNTFFDLEVSVNPTAVNIRKIENSIEMFNLNEVYESHKDFVRELMYKNFVYSNTYKEQLNKLFSNMKLNPSEINLFLYGSRLDAKELNTRPLSKLAFDVINEK